MPTESSGSGSGSAGMSGGGGFDFEGLFNGIDGAIENANDIQMSKETARGNDPCHLQYAITEALEVTHRPVLRNAYEAVNILSLELRRAVRDAIDRNGRPGGGYGGVTPFGEYLLETGTVDVTKAEAAAVALGGGPFTPGAGIALTILHTSVLLNMNSRLGAGRPSGSNTGFKLSPGAYLYAGSGSTPFENFEYGKLRGSRVRRLYDRWVTMVRRDAFPTIPGPAARPMLAALVGQTGGSYPFWRDGDRESRTSKLRYIREQIAGLERLQRTSNRECLRKKAAERADRLALVETAAGIELARIQTPVLVAGAVGVVAIALLRKKN